MSFVHRMKIRVMDVHHYRMKDIEADLLVQATASILGTDPSTRPLARRLRQAAKNPNYTEESYIYSALKATAQYFAKMKLSKQQYQAMRNSQIYEGFSKIVPPYGDIIPEKKLVFLMKF